MGERRAVMELYEVGGVVRDEIMGVKSKDIDFAVVAPSFEEMQSELEAMGFQVWLSTPQYYTLRARGPKDFEFAGKNFGNQTFDFVWARKDGPYSDGRRPDYVESGTLLDDLARRDFTMNAMAKASDGTLIDPFGGQEDIRNGLIRCVGNPFDRILKEDPLRGLRAMRFSITKEFEINQQILGVLKSRHFAEQIVKTTKAERVREELEKMFAANTLDSVMLLTELGLVGTLFNNQTGIRLMPTTKG
jgi:tRNA nucleotidyltransferase/poly(A) polymerase